MDTRIAAHAAATAQRSAAASFDRVLRDPTLAALGRAEPQPALPPHIAEALAHAAANPPPPIPAAVRAAFDKHAASQARANPFRRDIHPALSGDQPINGEK